jgi:TolA-binding protein
LERRLRTQYEELSKRQQMIARLAEEVDAARQEAQAAQAELARVKAAMPDPKEPAQAQLAKRLAACEVRAGDVQPALAQTNLAGVTYP